MKKLLKACLGASLLALSLSAVPVSAKDLGHEVLGPNDGWAAYANGTTGGAAADADHIFTVTNRTELIQALGGDNTKNKTISTPKIIYIKGTINLNVDDNNQPIEDDSFYSDGTAYDFDQYLETFSPEIWPIDKKVSDHELDKERKKAQQNQGKRILINVGSNTTIIGVGNDAKIVGGGLVMDGVKNVIIRNIEFEAPIDLFPQWDPADSGGNWNSEFDSVTITNSENIWIDHNTFGDGEHPDSKSGEYFGREYQQHDGLLDVKNGSDYVTVSYNVFQEHDKVTLVGSSDSSTKDPGHLKVTFHHNHYRNLSQRLPRVRFGQVHVYNNYYEFSKDSEYEYSYALGVGKESKIYAENNYFDFDWDVDPSTILKEWKGTSIYEDGSFVNGSSTHHQVDLVAAYNEANPSKPFDENVGWVPEIHDRIDPTQSVPALVKTKAGAGKLK
ncbi:polysaccharide lyase family 1 protein [Ammoniphilus sp. 3BR4]|uniref:pectate lyase family protein n=1 Tax=Ammoniphilus sp. 3BR4 TaxID=3158265 RepID=UPI003467C7FE